MKLSSIRNCSIAGIAFCIPLVQCYAPIIEPIIEPRDYNRDLKNFQKISQTMKNIRSLIGIPLAAFPGLSFMESSPTCLSVHPSDLILLPPDHRSRPPTTAPESTKDPILVELDPNQLLVTCQDLSVNSPFEWPLMRLCPEEERLLKDFLSDLMSRGNHLAIPQAQLEKAPVLEVNRFLCMPKNGTTCSEPAPVLPTGAASYRGIEEYLPSIYHASLPLTLATSSPTTGSSSKVLPSAMATSSINSSSPIHTKTIIPSTLATMTITISSRTKPSNSNGLAITTSALQFSDLMNCTSVFLGVFCIY